MMYITEFTHKVTEGLAKRLEAVQIVLVEKGGAAPGSTEKTFIKK